jgi:ELWxxDGT repeat protein
MLQPTTILLLLLLSCPSILHAQPTLEFDINQEAAGSTPSELLEHNDKVYLRANDGVHGAELWVYDLLTGQASLLADIFPFESSSGPNWLTELDGKIYFAADDGTHGDELWVHDPAQDTTYLVLDIHPGSEGSNIIYPTAYQGQLYFGAEADANLGVELYRYNPGSGQLDLIADIDPNGSSFPSFMTVFDGRLFLEADDGATGTELWVYDGIADTLGLVEEINIGPNNSNVAFLTVVEDRLYFRGNNGSTGDEVYAYDPVLDSILPLPEINSFLGANPSQFSEVDGALYLSARANDGTGQELWTYRPQTDSMFMVTDLNPGSGNSMPTNMIGYLGGVLFVADNGQLGRETYFYDPNTGSLSLYFEVQPGPTSSQPFAHIVVGNQVYFSAFRSDVNQELWRYVFTSGVELAADINLTTQDSDPSQFTEYAGRLYFRATQAQTGTEVWVHAPTNGTTQLLEDLQPGTASSEPLSFAAFDDRLFLSANFTNLGNELLVYDEATDEITLVADIHPGPNDALVQELTPLNGKLYFQADDGTSGSELWVYDPVSDQVSLVNDINPNGSSNPSELLVADGKLYFIAQENIFGEELYQYDPISNNLVVVDISNGATSGSPSSLAFCNGKLYFNAVDEVVGSTLHSYDPANQTIAVHLVGGIEPIPGANLTALGDLVFFRSLEFPGVGQELWSFNTTSQVVLLVEDLVPGAGSSSPNFLSAFEGKLYFQATTPAHGAELWTYDPNSGDLELFADIWEAGFGAQPAHLTAFQNKLFFSAHNGMNGNELWSYQSETIQPIVFDVGEACNSQDSSVLVPVFVENFTGVNAFQFSLHVNDPNIAGIIDLTNFALPNGDLFSFGGPETLTVLWDFPDTLGASLPDSTVLFTIELQLTGQPGQQTSLFIDGDPTPFIVGDPNFQSLPAVSVEGSACILPSVSISGRLLKETGEFVAQAEVQLSGDQEEDFATQPGGYYEFTNLPNGGSYTVTPEKDINPTNGVNVLDITRIRRHILGAESFSSPYQFIAGDVTHDELVNVIDISMIRSLILGIIPTYPSNTSWRFVPQDFGFPDPADPLATVFPESKIYGSLTTDTINQDFIAVKVGDVTNSSDPLNFNQPHPDRNEDPFFFVVGDIEVDASQGNELIFRADSFQNVTGFQFTLQYEEPLISMGAIQPIDLPNFNDSNFHIHEEAGWTTFAWTTADGQPISFPDETALFSVQFDATQSGTLASQLFEAVESPTPNLAFWENEDAQRVELFFTPISGTREQTDLLRVEVYPNPFSTETRIECVTSNGSPVTLSIVDATGREVYRDEKIPIQNRVQFEIGEDALPGPGVYWVLIRTQEGVRTLKLVRR